MAPTYTTNITGLRACALGRELAERIGKRLAQRLAAEKVLRQRERLGRHVRSYFGP
jgi:hypothetical protein